MSCENHALSTSCRAARPTVERGMYLRLARRSRASPDRSAFVGDADFASAALRSQLSLLNFTLVAAADGLSDAGAAALGAAIAGGDLQRVELMLR